MYLYLLLYLALFPPHVISNQAREKIRERRSIGKVYQQFAISLAAFLYFTRSRRNTNTDLRLSLKSSINRQKCLSFRGATFWNGLSTEAKQTTSIKAIKYLI